MTDTTGNAQHKNWRRQPFALCDKTERCTEERLREFIGSELLDEPPRGPGVYFLLRGPYVVYVGTSTNVSKRIARHPKRKHFERTVSISIAAEWERTDLETHFINAIRPRLNDTQRQAYGYYSPYRASLYRS